MRFIDEENILTYLVLIALLLSNLKLLQKSDRSTDNGITLPHPVKNPSTFPTTIGTTVLLMSSIPLISLWTRTICGTWLQQLLCHSTTLIIEPLCPVSTLNQQLINLEQTHIQCYFRCERRTVKGRDCAPALHCFQEITYRMDERNKQLLWLKI